MTEPMVLSISEQENVPDSGTNPSNEQKNQQTRTSYNAKRTKLGGCDDSFEREHRVVSSTIQYFNHGESRSSSNVTSATVKVKDSKSASPRPNFPPFRLNFVGDDKPSELSIIKSINKHFKMNITYGRFTNANKKSFLVFVNTGEQFDLLMDRTAWPDLICDLDYTIDLPSKVPSSYSIVAMGVPTQWNLTDFETDIKKQHHTVVKIERLLVRGGVPIPKVRIDFSNNEEVTRILKEKKIFFDDENTAFTVQPYSPPIKILRCFNCQTYNDHVAANCPHKDDPICFRCGDHHAYDPKCSNKIRCANCNKDHMAGNPNCSVKIEARKKILSNIAPRTTTKPNTNQSQPSGRFPPPPPPPSVWGNRNNPTTISQDYHNGLSNESSAEIPPLSLLVFDNKLDLLMKKVDGLIAEQATTNANINKLEQQISTCHNNLMSMKQFILNTLCPCIIEMNESLVHKNTPLRKEKLHVLAEQLKQNIHSFESGSSNDRYLLNMLPNSSSNESNS